MSGSANWPPVAVETPRRLPEAPSPGASLGRHYSGCFGCGNGESGLGLRARAGEDLSVRSWFEVREVHQGAPGLAHGGVLTAALDETLGSVCALVSYPAVTGKLETDFHQPVPVGALLRIDARVDGVAGRKVYVSAVAHIDGQSEQAALRARALFIRVDLEHFREHGTPPSDWNVEINP